MALADFVLVIVEIIVTQIELDTRDHAKRGHSQTMWTWQGEGVCKMYLVFHMPIKRHFL